MRERSTTAIPSSAPLMTLLSPLYARVHRRHVVGALGTSANRHYHRPAASRCKGRLIEQRIAILADRRHGHCHWLFEIIVPACKACHQLDDNVRWRQAIEPN